MRLNIRKFSSGFLYSSLPLYYCVHEGDTYPARDWTGHVNGFLNDFAVLLLLEDVDELLSSIINNSFISLRFKKFYLHEQLKIPIGICDNKKRSKSCTPVTAKPFDDMPI